MGTSHNWEVNLHGPVSCLGAYYINQWIRLYPDELVSALVIVQHTWLTNLLLFNLLPNFVLPKKSPVKILF
jgi:hypothetical protein